MKIIWETIKSRHAIKLVLGKDPPQEEAILKRIDEILGEITVTVDTLERALVTRHFPNNKDQTIFFHKWSRVEGWSVACKAVEEAIKQEFPSVTFENTPK